jgi:prepilin-type N-terminal cleavage/methylation domain-containing protein
MLYFLRVKGVNMRISRQVEKFLQKHRRCRKAFTLVEALVAMLIVGIMFTTIYAGITQSFAITRATRENLRAIQIMQNKTEAIRLYTWDQITNNSTFIIPTTFTDWFVPSAISTNGEVMYSGTLNITPSPLTESYAGDLRLVTITINWTSGKNSYTQQVSTLVSHYGLQNYIYN